MSEKMPRSPYDTQGGLIYFPRMLDKIRLHDAGLLPAAYHKHLGVDFDGRCLRLLGVTYDAVCARVLAGDSDEALLEWCCQNGRRLTEEEIETWSGFMLKRGWRDDVRDRVLFRMNEAGLEDREGKIVTMFDFIDVDEGRTPPHFQQNKPAPAGA